jgi:hypothetical protein
VITVTIFINGNPIYTRSACNRSEKNKDGDTKYETDTGEIIWHERDDGAIELAKQMLNTIIELK